MGPVAKVLVLGVVMAGLGPAAGSPAATAVSTAAAASPRLVSPAPGSSVAGNYEEPLVFDFTGFNENGLYDVEVSCPDQPYVFDDIFERSVGDAPMVRVPLPRPIYGPEAACRVRLYLNRSPSGYYVLSETFTVGAPPGPKVTNFSAPGYFYPHVREGYRDRAPLSWQLSTTAASGIEIRPLFGDRSRNFGVRLGRLLRGPQHWLWNAKLRNGSTAPAGDYRVRAWAYDVGLARRVTTTWRRVRVHRGAPPGVIDARSDVVIRDERTSTVTRGAYEYDLARVHVTVGRQRVKVISENHNSTMATVLLRISTDGDKRADYLFLDRYWANKYGKLDGLYRVTRSFGLVRVGCDYSTRRSGFHRYVSLQRRCFDRPGAARASLMMEDITGPAATPLIARDRTAWTPRR